MVLERIRISPTKTTKQHKGFPWWLLVSFVGCVLLYYVYSNYVVQLFKI